MPAQDLAIALNRFGIGARPDDAPPPDPRRWLLAQIDRYRPARDGLIRFDEASENFRLLTEASQDRRLMTPEERQLVRALSEARRIVRRRHARSIDERVQVALDTPTPFMERLVWFWSNHFAVSVDRPELMAFAGAFETDAIRPHVTGKFGDLLAAAVLHPAMLMFLDQTSSVGPASRGAMRAADKGRTIGLNENLAREILELHTLGVGGGYGQEDVRELARALTGWSVIPVPKRDADGKRPPAPDRPGTPVFRAARHEPGVRTVLGRRYPQPGEDQLRAILADLAVAPATARHLATKLARHVAGDVPPPALVDRMAAAYLAADGALAPMYRVLIEAPEAWTPGFAKFKTPWEWTVSTLRGIGRRSTDKIETMLICRQLGQDIWRPQSPAGFGDVASIWASSSGLMARVEIAAQLAAPIGDGLDPRTLAAKLLPGTLTPATLAEIGRAESVTTGLALLLVAPEFQRR